MHTFWHHYTISCKKIPSMSRIMIMILPSRAKHALVHAPFLAMPDFNGYFVIQTDARDMLIGAVWM